MSEIRAIETNWRGYRFRSRLEARWAVALDHAGIAWEYERQGYHLPSGPYLPDFWLPLNRDYFSCAHVDEPGYWLEIKGGDPSAHEITLAEELRDATGHTTFIAAGVPGEHRLWLRHHSGIAHYAPDGSPETDNPNCVGLTVLRLCPFEYRTKSEPRHYFWEAARSARFEHGETP